MDSTNRAWHWLVAIVVALILGSVSAIVVWSWYFSVALSPTVSFAGDGTAAFETGFSWSSLAGLALPTVILALISAGAGVGLYRSFGGRRGPAVLAAAGGAVAAFVLQISMVAYTQLVEVGPGENYLGADPIVLVGYVVAMILPAVVGATAVRFAA